MNPEQNSEEQLLRSRSSKMEAGGGGHLSERSISAVRSSVSGMSSVNSGAVENDTVNYETEN